MENCIKAQPCLCCDVVNLFYRVPCGTQECGIIVFMSDGANMLVPATSDGRKRKTFMNFSEPEAWCHFKLPYCADPDECLCGFDEEGQEYHVQCPIWNQGSGPACP